jgi:hypothetical protein
MSTNEQCDKTSLLSKIQTILQEKKFNSDHIGKVFFDLLNSNEEYKNFLELLKNCDRKPFTNDNIYRQELGYMILKNKKFISPIKYYSLSKNGRFVIDRSTFDIVEGFNLHYEPSEIIGYTLYFERSYPINHMGKYFTENISDDDNCRFNAPDNPFEKFYVPFYKGTGNIIRFPAPIPLYIMAYCGRIILEIKLKNPDLNKLSFVEPISYTVADYHSNSNLGRELSDFYMGNLASSGNNLIKVAFQDLVS